MTRSTAEATDGRHDFDFLFGHWTVHNSRLPKPFDPEDVWEEFDAEMAARPLLGGLGNLDEMIMPGHMGATSAISLRLFDPGARHWYIFWADNAHGTLTVPVIGQFEGDRGEFYNHELLAGHAILTRFIWSHITPQSCRWEQAFSEDGGGTWRTNWVMEFVRKPA